MKDAGHIAHPHVASARFKLARATDHLEVVGDAFEAFLRQQKFQVVGAYEPTTSRFQFVCEATADPPTSLALVVGDAVHNTYAALDHLIWGLADGHGTRRTQFPICSSAGTFEANRTRALAGIDPGVQHFIESLQPYHHRSLFASLAMESPPVEPHPLQALQALENVDKHRVLHTTTSVLNAATYNVTKNDDVEEHGSLNFTFGSFTQGDVFAYTGLKARGPNPTLGLTGEFAFRPALAFGTQDSSGDEYDETLEALRNRDLIEVLAGLSEYVGNIVDAVDRALANGETPRLKEPDEIELPFVIGLVEPGRWTTQITSERS